MTMSYQGNPVVDRLGVHVARVTGLYLNKEETVTIGLADDLSTDLQLPDNFPRDASALTVELEFAQTSAGAAPLQLQVVKSDGPFRITITNRDTENPTGPEFEAYVSFLHSALR